MAGVEWPQLVHVHPEHSIAFENSGAPRGDANAGAVPCQGSSGQSLTEIGTENTRVTRRGFGPQMDLRPSLDLTRTSHTMLGMAPRLLLRARSIPPFPCCRSTTTINFPISMAPKGTKVAKAPGRCETPARRKVWSAKEAGSEHHFITGTPGCRNLEIRLPMSGN